VNAIKQAKHDLFLSRVPFMRGARPPTHYKCYEVSQLNHRTLLGIHEVCRVQDSRQFLVAITTSSVLSPVGQIALKSLSILCLLVSDYDTVVPSVLESFI